MLLAHSLSPVLFFSSGFRAEIPLRVAHLIIAYAVFIGLAMETSSPARDFQAAEVYVTSRVQKGLGPRTSAQRVWEG